MISKPSLLLKWGSLKGWSNLTDEQMFILERWYSEGVSMSAMSHKDTESQKQAIIDLIDTMEDGQITNDWSGEKYTKEQAINYIKGY